jgi:heme ABC exporter ATP-binding subunit CcmA
MAHYSRWTSISTNQESPLHLRVQKLAKAYGFVWALRDLTLDLPPGEFVALLGPNGAGKTTLLKLLAGLIHPTRGTIELDDVLLSRATPTARARIGLLMPADHLYENLTVRENLQFFTKLYGQRHHPSRIADAIAEVGLEARADELVSSLSSGLKCRVSIAKWQLLKPGLLLLDEPYGVLDGKGVDLLEQFLLDQCRQGSIVILASHHVARVLKLCSRALILHRGQSSFDESRQEPWSSFDKAFHEFLPHGESWSS